MKNLLTLILLAAGWTSFGQDDGDNMFDETIVHEIRITFEQTDFWDSLEYYYDDYLNNDADKVYMLASVEIDGNTIDSVGVRQKGFYSNWGGDGLKKPLKINFKTYVEDQRFDGLKKINLQNGFKDPTMMRDALAYKFMRDAGIPAPRTSHAKVYINNTYWGLYAIVEQVDTRFLKRWFEDNDGNLFKCIDNTSLTWQGQNYVNYLDEFELKTNEQENDWSGFIDLVDKINTSNNFSDSITNRFRIGNYIKVLAADVLMYNWDSYYDHGRNFYLYEDSTERMFNWIPWDYNLAFSEDDTDVLLDGDAVPDMPGFPGSGSDAKPLIQRVMEDESLRSLYFNHICIMLEHSFNLANLEGYLDTQKALISQAMDDDPNKFYTFADFNNNFNSTVVIVGPWGNSENIMGLKTFITDRYQTVHDQFATHGHSCSALSVESQGVDEDNLIYPNPTDGIVNFELASSVNAVEIYNMDGKLLLRKEVQYANETIDLSDYASGIYLINLKGNQFSKTVKLIRR